MNRCVAVSITRPPFQYDTPESPSKDDVYTPDPPPPPGDSCLYNGCNRSTAEAKRMVVINPAGKYSTISLIDGGPPFNLVGGGRGGGGRGTGGLV
jgi:hypothetical protein